MANVLMPRLSDSMEEGTILKWLVEPGTVVSQGQDLVEIETDKATVVCQADEDGPFTILVSEGETRSVGEPIAAIGEALVVAGVPRADVPPKIEVAPAVAPQPAPGPSRSRPSNGNGGAPQRRRVSPIAQRLAELHDVELTSIGGSGRGGRILKADVLAAIAGAAPTPSLPAPNGPTVPDDIVAPSAEKNGQTTVLPLSRLQRIVAQRMSESRATIPDFSLAMSVDMEEAVALRGALKASLAETGSAPSYNDMVIKACALALREFPRVNGAYKNGNVELYEHINIGIAVAADGALVVPTVPDADTLSLGAIATATRQLSQRVRSNEITPAELAGGTFTVSNLGMFGVTEFTAVINPPQAAIVAVGAIEKRAVVRNDALVARHMMGITVSCDHRILDGASAAPFLARIRALLESPMLLLL